MAPKLAFADQLVDRASRLLGRKVSRRGFIARTTIAGTAVAAAGCVPITQQGSPFTFITDCPGGALCRDGYTEFCCVIHHGQNSCPPNSIPSGWWRADYSIYCNGTRYYIDCNDYSGGGPCRCGNGCDTRKVYCNAFRYGQCNMQVPGTGVIACRVVTCTPPYLIPGSNCVDSGAVDNSTAGHFTDCAPYVPAPPPPPPPPPPTSPPAVLPSFGGAASPALGEVLVVVRTTGGGISYQRYAGGVWEGWLPLPLPPGRSAASRIAAVSRGPGLVDALVVSDDRRLWWQHYEAGAWAPAWSSLGGSYSSDPALFVQGGAARSALRTSSGRTIKSRLLNGPSWSGEESLGGVSSSDPAGATRGGAPIVVVRGTGSTLFAKRRGGRWETDWHNLGNYGTSDPAAVADASSVWAFVRGENKGLYAKRFTGSWPANWVDLGGATVSSDPVGAFDGARVWLLARRGDSLWYRQHAGSWSAWQFLGHPPEGGIDANPVAVRDGNDLVVFVRAGGQLSAVRCTNGVPGGWEALPGVAVAATRGATKA